MQNLISTECQFITKELQNKHFGVDKTTFWEPLGR